MIYKLTVRKKVIKFIQKRDQKTQDKINEKLKLLILDPYSHPLLDTKKLANSPFYRLRINNYRFIYEVLEDELLILMLDGDNRGDIY